MNTASQLWSDSDELEQTWVTLVHLHRVDIFSFTNLKLKMLHMEVI